MKWVYLIVVLILGGLAYYYFAGDSGGSAPTSPRGAANAFVESALAGNMEGVRALCESSVAERAVRIAGEINAAAPDPRSFKWKNTAAMKPGVKALTCFFQGRVFTMELTQSGEQYQIVRLELAQ